MKQNILVLCTGNSCRSQIAEAYLRHFARDRAAVFSAGIETHGLNPRAVAVMAEVGIDISRQTSDHIDIYRDVPFDYVITVCDHAREQCPVFATTAQRFHQNFPDPAKASGTEAGIMDEFRMVRDQIRGFCEAFVNTHLAPRSA